MQLPEDLCEAFFRKAAEIPDEQLSVVEGTHINGREMDPHITVKYGLHTSDPAEVECVLKEYGPIEVTMLAVEKFESDDYDVLYVGADSDKLHDLNALITAKLECTDTHPEYMPHATLAYVKKDIADKLVGDEFVKGRKFVVDRVVFSRPDGTKKEILLSSGSGGE